jgi:hypothetical protein
MSSLTLGTPAPGQAVGRRAPAEGAVTGPVPDRSRREGVAETRRVVASMIALYAFLLVLPLLVLAPILLTGLFLGILTTLFSGIV